MRAATDAPATADETFHRRFLWGVTALLAIGLWLWPMRSSLWTDELGTWWVIKDGLGDTIDRALTFHGQSPLFYVLLWGTRHVAGRSEVALRLPSLLAATGAAAITFVLVRRLVNDEAARLTTVAFVGVGGIAFAATDARPYALGVLVAVAACLALVRWLDEGGWWRGALFVVLTIAIVWVHYMLALIIPVLFLYALLRRRSGDAAPPGRSIAVAGAACIVGVLPLAAQLASLWSRRGSLAVPNIATFGDLLREIVPLALPVGVAIGALVARTQGELHLGWVRARPGAAALAGTWLAFPLVILFVLSIVTGVMLFAPRYYVLAAPAAAAIFGWFVASTGPASARRIIAACFAIVAILVSGGALKNGEDWRGAVAFTAATADPDTLVLVHPAFVESSQPDWLDDPVRRSYLLSPLAYYPLDAEVVLLPFVLDPSAEHYLAGVVDERLGGRDRFLIVTNYADVPFAPWLDGRLGPDGWSSRVIGGFGEMQVIEFTRSGGR